MVNCFDKLCHVPLTDKFAVAIFCVNLNNDQEHITKTCPCNT